jgi:hypothetical protein
MSDRVRVQQARVLNEHRSVSQCAIRPFATFFTLVARMGRHRSALV